jgi:NADH-quinone oxidoreductase subunit M
MYIKNAKAFYALILFMAFAMAGTLFLASDGLFYIHLLGIILNPYLFHCPNLG